MRFIRTDAALTKLEASREHLKAWWSWRDIEHLVGCRLTRSQRLLVRDHFNALSATRRGYRGIQFREPKP